jgi:hypothetical protein
VLTFKKVQHTGHPREFWRTMIRPDIDKDRKQIIRLERTDVPAELRRTATTPQQMDAAGTAAAKMSVADFMRFVSTLRSCPAQSNKVVMVEMQHVGVKCEGRSGPYDLLYFPRTDEIFAADSNIEGIVYKMSVLTH